MVRVSRSFSYKFFPRQYEPRDFFASLEMDCLLKDVSKVSAKLHQMAREQVLESVASYKTEMLAATKVEANDVPVIQEQEPKKTKNDYIAEAMSKKRDMNDDDNTNGYVNATLAAGEREDYNNTFNKDNLDILEKRNR